MIIIILLLIFSFIIVFIGGFDENSISLYYDIDFVELYEVKESENSDRVFSGGKRIEDVEEHNVKAEESEILNNILNDIGISKEDFAKMDMSDDIDCFNDATLDIDLPDYDGDNVAEGLLKDIFN